MTTTRPPRRPPAKPRRSPAVTGGAGRPLGKTLALAIGSVVMAAGIGWLGVDDLTELVRAVRAGAPLITVRTGSAAALPCSVALGAVAAMLLLEYRSGRTASDTPARLVMGLMFGCVPLLVLLPLLLLLGSAWILPGQGYERCGGPRMGQRFTTIDWQRGAPGACPR